MPGKPKSALKSFALALPDAEEPELQLSNAKAMRARSKRVSSVATSLLKGLQVTCQPHDHVHRFFVRDMFLESLNCSQADVLPLWVEPSEKVDGEKLDACTAAWVIRFDHHVLLTQDSELTAKMKDGDTDALAAQNQYLKEALETCRTQILELTQQVH